MGGTSQSRIATLLDQMGWTRPSHAEDFESAESLVSYLRDINLEVNLPRHAPQMDISIGDRKPRMYPRPSFCYEGYKMHLAMIGPSSSCKRQFTEFIPHVTDVFQGPGIRMGPGREAVPHYFLDPVLHRMVLWELPEINFKQSSEAYIKELGLLYIDCVFVLFSDKYLLTDVYCKLIVAMAIHGIPFFVICTQSSPDIDEKTMEKLKSDFQRKDIQGIRIFNPARPHKMMEELILDFYKEISYNRGANNKEFTKDVGEAILGQTVRLKGLEKRPELNGRCGVCIGYDSGTDRYLARMITDGVEQDISLKQSSFSILKPKLIGQMVQVKGLQAKPELNGRFGFVDEFLRETERYRVFLPDRPGRGLVLALKSENLEKVDSCAGAVPIKAEAALPSSAPKAAVKAKAKASTTLTPKAAAKSSGTFDPPAREKPRQSDSSSVPESRKSAAAPSSGPGTWSGPSSTSTSGPAAAPASVPAKVPAASPDQASSTSGARRQAAEAQESDDDDPLAGLFGAREEEEKPKQTDNGGDLMSRIFAAENETDDDAGLAASKSVTTGAGSRAPTAASAAEKPATTAVESPAPRPRLQLSLQGLLGMRVWAVVGDPDEVEEMLDHLMDCGKTVFSVSAGGSAHFASTAELDRDPGLPRAEVLAFVDPQRADVRAGALDAKRFGLRGIVLHPEAAAYGPDALEACRDAGMTVHSADILSQVEPGLGLPVAPLD